MQSLYTRKREREKEGNGTRSESKGGWRQSWNKRSGLKSNEVSARLGGVKNCGSNFHNAPGPIKRLNKYDSRFALAKDTEGRGEEWTRLIVPFPLLLP